MLKFGTPKVKDSVIVTGSFFVCDGYVISLWRSPRGAQLPTNAIVIHGVYMLEVQARRKKINRKLIFCFKK